MQYDVLIVGGGPGGIYSAYELLEKRPDLKIALFEAGHALARRHCPIDGVKVKSCVKCPTCAIMNGFGGAGAFSDGKYNITNQFGGTLHEYIGKKQALELMEYVDEINVANGGEGTHLYSTGATPIKKLCLENDLHLLDASVRHLGTDKNLVVLEHLYNRLKDRMDIYFDTPVQSVERTDGGYRVVTDKGSYDGRYCVISVGRSGSKWMEQVCRELDIATRSNRVDIGVRVELPYEVFAHLTDELYESKIVYRTEKFEDNVRTFCMNPHGIVVNENTNGIVTVNGHSYEDPAMHTENTNFALLVAKHFSEPFKDSNGYGESIARLSNMLGGGVIGIEFAYVFSQFGCKVRVLEMAEEILPMVDAEVAAMARRRLEKDGVDFCLGAKVTRIRKDAVVYERNGETHELPARSVLMSLGRRPRVQELGAENIGLTLERGAIACDEHLVSSLPNIYVVGDANGKAMLAHTAFKEAEIAVANICGGGETMRYDRIPSCIYMSPEIASVGLTEAQAREQYGDGIRVGRFPPTASPWWRGIPTV